MYPAGGSELYLLVSDFWSLGNWSTERFRLKIIPVYFDDDRRLSAGRANIEHKAMVQHNHIQ